MLLLTLLGLRRYSGNAYSRYLENQAISTAWKSSWIVADAGHMAHDSEVRETVFEILSLTGAVFLFTIIRLWWTGFISL